MAFVKIPDEWADSPDVDKIGAEAALLHLKALSYSNRYLTNGAVPEKRVRMMASTFRTGTAELTYALVEAGLWQKTDRGDFQITAEKGLLGRQWTPQQVENYRSKDVERVRKFRSKRDRLKVVGGSDTEDPWG